VTPVLDFDNSVAVGNTTYLPYAKNRETVPSLGSLNVNATTFSHLVEDLKSCSTLLLSQKDERWANAAQCARSSDNTSSE
jgi:hypothetical protein